MTRVIHCDLSGKCGFEENEKWHDHVLDSALENDNCKLQWDFSVRTDHKIGARRSNLMIIDEQNKRCQIIDEVILEVGRVRKKMWGVRTKVVPVVVGALGSVPLREQQPRNH